MGGDAIDQRRACGRCDTSDENQNGNACVRASQSPGIPEKAQGHGDRVFRNLPPPTACVPQLELRVQSSEEWEVISKHVLTPYDAIPRTVPDSTNPENAPAAKQSKRLDFSGPDRTEGLGEILWYYRKGTPHPGSWLDVELNASASTSKSGRHGVDDDDDDDRDSHEPALTSSLHYDLDDEDEIERRERDAYDLEIARFQRWLLENPAAQEKVRRAQARSREKRNTSVAK